MLLLKNYHDLRSVILVLSVFILPLHGHTQKTTPQIAIDARFIEVNQQNLETFGMSLDFQGDQNTAIDAIDLYIGDGWDVKAETALLPQDWNLNTETQGLYRFSGPRQTLPLKLEWLMAAEPPNMITVDLFNNEKSVLKDFQVPVNPMDLPNVPAVKIKPEQPPFRVSPFLDWQHICVDIGDLNTSVKTHKYQGDLFPNYTTYGETFHDFSRARLGSKFNFDFNDNLSVNLNGSYLWGCQRRFKQGWTYDPDPVYFNRYELDFNFSTFSLGAGVDYKFKSQNSVLDRLEFGGGFNLDFHHLNLDYKNEMAGATPVLNTGILEDNNIGFSFNAGINYNFYKDFKLGIDVSYISAEFDDVSGKINTFEGTSYDARLSMEPIEAGDYITIHPSDQSYGEGWYPATIDITGFTFALRLQYEFPIAWYPGAGKDQDEDDGDDPRDTPPPTVYGEDLESEENEWNAYVFIGSIDGPASIYEAAIINSADEAQSDFEKAGYNVIANYSAKYPDFQAVIDDPRARAFWFAGHGTEDDNGPIPMIREAKGEGITPSEKYYPIEASLLFRKDNLNQVTMHACKQDLPEWRAAFPGATYDSWSISPIGPMMYWWQLAATYPEIDPETGFEKGR